MWPILLHLLPATLYIGVGLYCWRTRTTPPTTPALLQRGARGLLALALLLHGFALHQAIFPGATMYFGFAIALSLMVWLAICFCWVETLYNRLDGLLAIALPTGAVAAVLPAIFPAAQALSYATYPIFRVHLVIAMLAYSLFTLAMLHALLMAIATRQLHHARFSRALAGLPPLLTMEALLFRLIGVAFALLTLTLITGVMFSESLFDTAFRLDHKTVFTFISWLLFGVLLAGRRLRGWRGRVALRWTLAGFVTLMLAYVGSHFVLDVVLQH
ncbi:ABC transporter permease [Betaproteobacteria bacterium]|nr:ABC transporter permease [Betaproteobacteria bacterium]GHU28209.1 ABC transporter permease [Betaproteobacteria bacterium]